MPSVGKPIHTDSQLPAKHLRKTAYAGRVLLDGIDGRSNIARRFRDIMRGLLVEFEVTTEADQALVRQAAVLAVLSEQLQATRGAIIRGRN